MKSFKKMLNRIVARDAQRMDGKIKDRDFTVADVSIDPLTLRRKLHDAGYTQISENCFHREYTDNGGDSLVTFDYDTLIFQPENVSELLTHSDKCGKGLTRYTIAMIFVERNLEENLTVLKRYAQETAVDVEMHPYGYKPYFAPLVITDRKVYYFKAGSIVSGYRHAIEEGLRILDIPKST